MASLTDDIKTEIVIKLAQFRGYSEIARAISIEFAVAVDRFQVRSYDPTKPTYAAGDKWRSLFENVRKAYLTDISAVPIAQKAYRLNELQRNYEIVQAQGNLSLASSLLRQAAEEVGGALTNQRDVSVSPGRAEIENMSLAERREKLAQMIKDILSRQQPRLESNDPHADVS